MVRARLVVFLLLSGCERASSDGASVDPDSGASEAAASPPADSFEISILNRCPQKWRYYVAPAASQGHGQTAAESEVVPESEYTFLEPGVAVQQRLRPGDVVWMVNQQGESTATGFQTKAEGEGGRLEVTPACDGVKRVRLVMPGQP
jgi:hypothetical protein